MSVIKTCLAFQLHSSKSIYGVRLLYTRLEAPLGNKIVLTMKREAGKGDKECWQVVWGGLQF